MRIPYPRIGPTYPPPAAHRVVAFDFGGVLFDVDVGRYLELASEAFQVSTAALATATFESGIWSRAEVGLLDGPGFLRAVLRQLKLPSGPQETAKLSRAWCRIIRLRPGAVELLRRVRIDCCGWSNTDPVHAGEMSRLPGFWGAIGQKFLSFDLGVEKPAVRFFQLAVAELAVSPQRIVYIDDRADNVASARALGIDAFVATSLAGVESGLAARRLI